MYSVNVPVPAAVERVAADLHGDLYALDSVREQHTLVAKRLGSHAAADYPAVEKRAREALRGAPAFDARVAGVETFDRPPSGDAPVVYLAVESPGLRRVHDRLADAFDPVSGIEGDDYVPHVTLASGGDADAVERVVARDVEPVSWTVTELEFYDARRGERVSAVSLPA